MVYAACACLFPVAHAGSQAKWARLVKKALDEDAAHMAALWQLLLKQAHWLFPYRSLFTPSVTQLAIK